MLNSAYWVVKGPLKILQWLYIYNKCLKFPRVNLWEIYFYSSSPIWQAPESSNQAIGQWAYRGGKTSVCQGDRTAHCQLKGDLERPTGLDFFVGIYMSYTYTCTLKPFLFVGYLISCISLVGQSMNLRFQWNIYLIKYFCVLNENQRIQVSTYMSIILKPWNFVPLKLNDFTVILADAVSTLISMQWTKLIWTGEFQTLSEFYVIQNNLKYSKR